MRIRESIGGVLLVLLALSAARAQTPSPSLQNAERAFAESLLNHDRAAFTAMFTADAECSLPSRKHGPQEIAAAWLPFFVDPNTTMVLTSSEAITAQSGDSGNTTGTFAIKGRTSNGIRTIPGGTYSIVWRLVDGRWKISTLGAG